MGIETAGRPAAGQQEEVARALADPAFGELVRERGRLGALVVGSIVVVYFGYILLLAFAPGLMHSHVTPVITAGFPLGLAVMVFTFVVVAVYVRRSSGRFDALIARVRAGVNR